MKNLFRFLATSMAQSNLPDHFQNTPSQHLVSSFFTTDGDAFETFESSDAGITFGVIKIQLNQPYFYLTDAAQVLHHFVSLLQNSFEIVHTTDAVYTMAHGQKLYATTVYWQDATQMDWKVQGWTNGHRMAVQYVKNITSLPVEWEEYFFSRIAA